MLLLSYTTSVYDICCYDICLSVGFEMPLTAALPAATITNVQVDDDEAFREG
jgi:hypothetical protein